MASWRAERTGGVVVAASAVSVGPIGRRRLISARGERTGGVVVSGGGSVAEDEKAVAVCRRGGSRKCWPGQG